MSVLSDVLYCFILMLTSVIVQKGVSVNMLKVGSKRRRPTAEVKEERRESDKKEMELQMKLAELKAFERQLKLK